jgi:hypothetical protein
MGLDRGPSRARPHAARRRHQRRDGFVDLADVPLVENVERRARPLLFAHDERGAKALAKSSHESPRQAAEGGPHQVRERAACERFSRSRLHSLEQRRERRAPGSGDLFCGGLVQAILTPEVVGDRRLIRAGSLGEIPCADRVVPVLAEDSDRCLDQPPSCRFTSTCVFSCAHLEDQDNQLNELVKRMHACVVGFAHGPAW